MKNLFKKETNIEIFNRMKVELSNGETGNQILTRRTIEWIPRDFLNSRMNVLE